MYLTGRQVSVYNIHRIIILHFKNLQKALLFITLLPFSGHPLFSSYGLTSCGGTLFRDALIFFYSRFELIQFIHPFKSWLKCSLLYGIEPDSIALSFWINWWNSLSTLSRSLTDKSSLDGSFSKDILITSFPFKVASFYHKIGQNVHHCPSNVLNLS